MAGTFTPTSAYTNLTRIELEALRKADFYAGGKALTVGDAGNVGGGVGPGSLSAEPYTTGPTIVLNDAYVVTPPTNPGLGLGRLSQVAVNVAGAPLPDSETVRWYGPRSVRALTSPGQATAPLTWQDTGTDFTAGVVVNPGDLVLIRNRVGGAGANENIVGVVSVVAPTTLTLSATSSPLSVDGLNYYYTIVRPEAIQLFAVPGSGPTGREATFLAVTPGSTLHTNLGPTVDQINADRVRDLIPPSFALDSTVDRADAVFAAPAPLAAVDKLGYRVILYPDDGTGTGPDLTSPITTLSPTIDGGIPAADQRMSIDYKAGVVRFSCAPVNGSDIKPSAGCVNGVTGRLNLYAVFFAQDQYLTAGSVDHLYKVRNTETVAAAPAGMTWDEANKTWVFHTTDANIPVSNTTDAQKITTMAAGSFQAKSIVYTLNGRIEVTCGDGTLTSGDFTGVNAINDAITWWQTTLSGSTRPASLVIHLKAGSYNWNTDVVIPAQRELRIIGAGRSHDIGVTTYVASFVTFTSTGDPITVDPRGLVVLEDASFFSSAGHAISVAGSIRTARCSFESVTLSFVDVGAPWDGFRKGNLPTDAALFDDTEFTYTATTAAFLGQLTGTNSVLSGLTWKNCRIRGPLDGSPVLHLYGDSVATTYEHIRFENCKIELLAATATGATTISAPSGLVYVQPTNDLVTTLHDITYDHCDVTVRNPDVGASCSTLLHLFPLTYNATSTATRAIIGEVTIRGGVWDISQDALGTDFVPFFLMAAKPIVENLTIVMPGVPVDGFTTSPGFRGQGGYTNAMWWALINSATPVVSAAYGVTIAAAGAALISPSSSPSLSTDIATGLVVRGLTINTIHRESFSGDLALIGPGLDCGPVDVQGVRLDCAYAGSGGNTKIPPGSRIFIRPGGLDLTKGSHGVFQNILWSAYEDLPVSSDLYATFGFITIGNGGDVHVQGVQIRPRECLGAPNVPISSYGITAGDFWSTQTQGGHLRLSDSYVENIVRGVVVADGYAGIELDSIQYYLNGNAGTPVSLDCRGIDVTTSAHAGVSTVTVVPGATPAAAITGLTGGRFSQAAVGTFLTLTGLSVPANNGTFYVLSVQSPTAVTVSNAAAVAEGPTAAVTWSNTMSMDQVSITRCRVKVLGADTLTVKGIAVTLYDGFLTHTNIHQNWVRANGPASGVGMVCYYLYANNNTPKADVTTNQGMTYHTGAEYRGKFKASQNGGAALTTPGVDYTRGFETDYGTGARTSGAALVWNYGELETP